MSTQAKAKCPLCGKPSQPAATPFCSAGCRDRDLLNWLGDAYRVPVRPSEDGERDDDQAGLDSAGSADL